MSQRILLVGILCGLMSTSALASDPSPSCKRATLMAYNVENLWDAVNDPDQGDYTYLPKALKDQLPMKKLCAGKSGFRLKECLNLDWTEAKYHAKLSAIHKVVMAFNEGKGPDVLVMEELENRRVLEDLRDRELGADGFKYLAHFESPSDRGIDVGILSRLPIIRSEKHKVDLGSVPGGSDTRDILEAEVEACGSRLVIAANHWPSLAHPTEARRVAAKVLESVADSAIERGVAFVAAGDFNTLPTEDPNPIAGEIAGDAESLPLIDFNPVTVDSRFPPATHYYQGEWSPLDRILVSKEVLDDQVDWAVGPAGFAIFTPDFVFTVDPKTQKRIPNRFDFDKGVGYSDHLPVTIELIRNQAGLAAR